MRRHVRETTNFKIKGSHDTFFSDLATRVRDDRIKNRSVEKHIYFLFPIRRPVWATRKLKLKVSYDTFSFYFRSGDACSPRRNWKQSVARQFLFIFDPTTYVQNNEIEINSDARHFYFTFQIRWDVWSWAKLKIKVSYGSFIFCFRCSDTCEFRWHVWAWKKLKVRVSYDTLIYIFDPATRVTDDKIRNKSVVRHIYFLFPIRWHEYTTRKLTIKMTFNTFIFYFW